MQPHQQRVVDEKAELNDKLSKLGAFITSSPIFSKLNKAEQERLKRQQGLMAGYSEVLDERIEAF